MTTTLVQATMAEANGSPSEAAGEAAVQNMLTQLEALREHIRRQGDAVKQLQQELEVVRSERDTYVQALKYYWKDDLRPFTEEEIRDLDENGLSFSETVKELRRELEAKR